MKRQIALGSVMLSTLGCPWIDKRGIVHSKGIQTDPVEPTLHKVGKNHQTGQQPVNACLDLFVGAVSPTEVGSVKLRYVETCSATNEPCFAANAQSTAAPTWYQLDSRHQTFTALVYRTSTQSNGEIPLTIQGPPNRAWRLQFAVNELDPDAWRPGGGEWIEQPATATGSIWPAPTGLGLDVGTRHLAVFRAVVETLNDDGTTWSDPIDPLVILVPKRPNKACSVTAPFGP